MRKYVVITFLLFPVLLSYAEKPEKVFPGMTLHLSYETEADILSDFLSSAKIFRVARPGAMLENPLERRKLEIAEGKFGKALHIKHGWSVTKGTANESGADLDLIVATIWGDWRTKPHYWGAGRFHGDRGTITFWVKTSELYSDPLYPVFIQTSTAWGRNERDVLRIDVDKEGRLSASIRDIFYQYHDIKSENSVWANKKWQHIAVTYDQAYGLKLYHDGRLVASNWGNDSWWQTPLPGLFCPFLPESYYDEIYFFDYPLDEEEIQSLCSSNTVPERKESKRVLDDPARERQLSSYGKVEDLELPVLLCDEEILSMKQIEIADCHDEKIPAWWVMDGRYELAWPHPYLLFTFILGDVDFHGTKVDIDFKEGETANYISMEGILDGIEVIPGKPGNFKNHNKIIDLNGYPDFFYSSKLDMGSNTSLHFPMLKRYGTPPGLVDKGTLKFPLTGKIRLHEVQLWNVKTKKTDESKDDSDIVWYLSHKKDLSALDIRYLDAVLKLMGTENRTLFLGSKYEEESDVPYVSIDPFQSFQFLSPDLNPDMAVDKIRLRFYVIPEKDSDVLWIKLRDPANPSRIWAKSIIRLKFNDIQKPQRVEIELDPVDLMLASEERLWIEMKFANREKIMVKSDSAPKLGLKLSLDREKSLSAYARHEMIPARMQYIKEYNYQPWLFTGELRNIPNLAFSGGPIPMSLSYISGQMEGLKYWSSFGGPYDMWYPPEAVLRHDPANEIAGIYKRLTGERAQTYGGYGERIFSPVERLKIAGYIPYNAPSWAVWEREMYKKQLRTIHWIVDMQREDGFFWGGSNDDVFIPLGYAGIPLMGDEASRKSFLKLYDGLEKAGIYKDGYCDIWPIDYLHITDFLASRGLMVPYALGDPYVLEREMITARVYKDIMEKNNAERAKKGLPPFEPSKDTAKKEAKLWGEKLVQDYELAQVLWYWGKTASSKPHNIIGRDEIARKMMTITLRYDKTEEFEWTKALRHTDRQGSAPGRDELITAALGGRLQGRIEPHPHSMVVSWDNPDPDITRLVSYGNTNSTRVNFFNFKPEPQEITMRLWRIPKGEYLLKVGKDLNDDGVIDSEKSVIRQEKMKLRRFSTINLTIPSRQNVVLNLDLTKQLKRAEKLPDLALHPVKDIKQEGDTLKVIVHNIGDGIAKNVSVEVVDQKGIIIGKRIIPEILAPVDLVPKTAELEFRLNGRSWDRIIVDRENTIEEILEENNEATNKEPVQ
jgi:hypothetical protein